MKMKVLAGAAIAAAAMAMTGCSTMPGVVMDKSKPLEQNGYTVIGDGKTPVSCTMTQWTILGFGLPPVFDGVSDEAVANAVSLMPCQILYRKCLAKNAADALIEYSVDRQFLNLVWVSCAKTTMSGIPVKEKK